jgi:hypothetical protein
MKQAITNMASFASFQAQTMTSLDFLRTRLSEFEMREKMNQLKYENSLRLFSEMFSKLEDSRDGSIEPSAQSYTTSSSQPRRSVAVCKTEITEQEKKDLPLLIETLTEAQMSNLVARIKQEKIFPIPSTGEFEIDMSLLLPKQLLQLFILIRNVRAPQLPSPQAQAQGKKRGRPPSSSSSSSSSSSKSMFAGGDGYGEED